MNDDARGGRAQEPGGGDVIARGFLVHGGAQEAGAAHPAKHGQDAHQHDQRGADQRADDHDDEKEGQHGPNLNQAVAQQVNNAAKVSQGAADQHPDREHNGDVQHCGDERLLPAAEEHGQYIVAVGVGAEEMLVPPRRCRGWIHIALQPRGGQGLQRSGLAFAEVRVLLAHAIFKAALFHLDAGFVPAA